VEFLGTWELLHNPAFKGVEFDTFLHEAGANRFNMTPRKWIEATNAIGIISKAGRKGGTYAHKDIVETPADKLQNICNLRYAERPMNNKIIDLYETSLKNIKQKNENN
jgi:hypothetical protein